MQVPKNPMELYRLYSEFSNNKNPMAAFKQVFGDNPVFARLAQMVDGKSEAQVKQIVFNLCRERGIDPEKGINILRNVGFKL